MDLEKLAEYNNILSSPEKISVYLTLYYATAQKETLDIQIIIKKIKKKWGCEMSYNKVKYILDNFVDEGIVNKNINNTPHEYYLTKKIFIPSSHTPLPFYQILIFVSSFGLLYYSFYLNSETLKLISVSSLVTSLIFVFLHQLLFEISREEIKNKIIKRKRVWKSKINFQKLIFGKPQETLNLKEEIE